MTTAIAPTSASAALPRPGVSPDSAPLLLDWATFGRAAREVATQVLESGWVPDVVASVPRGGLFTAGALSVALGIRDVAVLGRDALDPDARVSVPTLPAAAFAGRRVLVADDYAASGATLAAARAALAPHAAEVRFAVIVERSYSTVPCLYSWRTADRPLQFPWSPWEPLEFGRS